ncbi:Sugar transport protein MST5 [Glycine max]|nr:Sugar transport protein MST5 [Glycine max]
MEGGYIRNASGKKYPGMLTTRVFYSCFIAAHGDLIFGCYLGIPGVYGCKLNGQTLTFFTSSVASLAASTWISCGWCFF